MKKLGLDIGSTTIKCVVLDEENNILYSTYKRHFSRIVETAKELLRDVLAAIGDAEMHLAIAGSAGMGMAEKFGLDFVQEVYATKRAVNMLMPETDAVIELGGEDAKIIFLSGTFEARMNGSCAGGTGAFIDQMATLIHVTPDELNELAKNSKRLYTIASRCGVFAKSDIQPLINQGADLADVSASIFKAVVNQTIGGLAQGREIKGNVLYLGGPLTFFSELRKSFDESLGIKGTQPENSLYFVAFGSALSHSEKVVNLAQVAKAMEDNPLSGDYLAAKPLFTTEEDFQRFLKRHKLNSEKNIQYILDPEPGMYVGIDAGSTTVKAVVCNKDGAILDSMYQSNHGNPVPIVKDYLQSVYERYPGITFAGAAVTGYGEELIKNAFHADMGIVETIAHYTAAKKFRPDVDFIIDIGGQDIKCFKIRNGAIDNIFLNEACSSGCGSFLQTFAQALGYEMEEFANLGLFADKPVELGSRCTVFMNSSVKQAQKDGASIENISAGLSMSVVKNALYKVIRCNSANDLGKNIVVQGGTFLNDAVLRAFEQEIGQQVIRPEISGLMGAYGAALCAVERVKKDHSSLISKEDLEKFTYKVATTFCNGCDNHCQLTINTFENGRRFIAGNRCDKPLAKKDTREKYNLYEYKVNLLDTYRNQPLDPAKKTIGIPMGLNMYELLPFWHAMFTHLGFNVLVSPASNRDLYLRGQHTIPSDTVCFPAKMVHGHIEALIEQKPDAIFYPCMSYNVEENKGDNHFNCPVVAYYPQVIGANVQALSDIPFISDFVGIHNKKEFPKKFAQVLQKHLGTSFNVKDVAAAADAAWAEYEKYMQTVREEGRRYIEIAKSENRPVIVIVGRPYHLDPEVNHGLDKLICDLGAIVVTEDSVSYDMPKFRTTVLNQWTYHARLYLAAKYVAEAPKDLNINLVQFVSFGCGVDAITSDETRKIIEESGKIYTQLKIDEVTNTGAARIRIRSLFAAAGIEE